MSRAGRSGSAPTRWRAVQAALVGIAAGLVGVTISRILFGPAAAPVGIVIGAAALASSTALSWRLNGRRRPADSPAIPRSLRLRRRVHPLAWIGPVAGSIITLVAWVAVAHSSGSGWVQAVGALLGAFLAARTVRPVRALVELTRAYADGRVVVYRLSASTGSTG